MNNLVAELNTIKEHGRICTKCTDVPSAHQEFLDTMSKYIEEVRNLKLVWNDGQSRNMSNAFDCIKCDSAMHLEFNGAHFKYSLMSMHAR